MIKFLIKNIHIWRHHDGIQRTCRICSKHQINIIEIDTRRNLYTPIRDNWRDLN